MTPLSDLVEEVVLLTHRPDMEAEITSLVKAATIAVHHIDYFYKDLYEVSIDLGESAYEHSIDFSPAVPRIRTWKYIRKYDNSGTGSPAQFYNLVDPTQVVDSYKNKKTNIYYVAGDVVNIRSSDAVQYLLLGCYRHPDIATDTYSSWVANEYPYTIIYTAVANTFKAIGASEQAVYYQTLKVEYMTELRNSNLYAEEH